MAFSFALQSVWILPRGGRAHQERCSGPGASDYPPEIFNTDQGSQFTSAAFTGRLASAGIRTSMDGRGCWLDNVKA